MSVLAHLRDQHAVLTSLASLESIDAVDHPRPAVIVRICAAVDTLYRLGNSVIATESVFQGLTDLTKRRAFAGRVHCQSQQIAGSLGTFAQCVQRSLASSRSEEHTSELQSLMRISYAVFCLKKQKTNNTQKKT